MSPPLSNVAAPNLSDIGVRAVEEVSGSVDKVSVNTGIPAANQLPILRNAMNNGATSAAVADDCSGTPLSSCGTTPDPLFGRMVLYGLPPNILHGLHASLFPCSWFLSHLHSLAVSMSR